MDELTPIYIKQEVGRMDNICSKTRHQVGKVTYIVVASSSENAVETLDIRLKKLIKKDVIKSNNERYIN